VRAPKGVLTRSTVNQYLTLWHLDQPRLRRQPPAVRFQAEHSNDCWQFDMSPSDLKRIDKPDWIEPGKGEPTLMLYSVDDRSGVAYQDTAASTGKMRNQHCASCSTRWQRRRTPNIRSRVGR
jgi:hypothetical protein